MPSKMSLLGVHVPAELLSTIDSLASSERRPRANMARTLIYEALAVRQDGDRVPLRLGGSTDRAFSDFAMRHNLSRASAARRLIKNALRSEGLLAAGDERDEATAA